MPCLEKEYLLLWEDHQTIAKSHLELKDFFESAMHLIYSKREHIIELRREDIRTRLRCAQRDFCLLARKELSEIWEDCILDNVYFHLQDYPGSSDCDIELRCLRRFNEDISAFEKVRILAKRFYEQELWI